MFNIILFQPEIPPNTGNIIRLTANTGSHLHLIRPLGFTLDDKRMRRAGLDYHDLTYISIHDSLDDCLNKMGATTCYALSTKGQSPYHRAKFKPGDALLFGPETRGLPHEVLSRFNNESLLTIPQRSNSRSLNLSNSVSIVLYEAWRQQDFK